VLSSITKKGEIESVSRPHSGFWYLNDKTIKELIWFAKCETRKMSYNYIEIIRSSRHVMTNLITHFKCHMTRRILLREKEEQRIDYLYFMSISILEYIRDMKTQSLTSTLIFNMKKSFKSVLMEGMKKCVSRDDS
jgi:hypothetical protein